MQKRMDILDSFWEKDYISNLCVEKNPLRIYKKDQEPVYKDSAMEAFFNLKEMIRQMKCSAEIQEE